MLSNLVSNVPAVLVFKPFVAALPDHDARLARPRHGLDPGRQLHRAGLVANLIVVEKAARRGVVISFWDYFRVGAPLTVLTLAVGTFWLMWR